MKKIFSIQESSDFLQVLHSLQKEIVLVGGCFDVLHVGHIRFLEKAKKEGNVLVVLLENDERIKKIKGNHRPFNTQKDRAKVLSAIAIVDYIILLPQGMENNDYDVLISTIKPVIIATTLHDPGRIHKERQATATGAVVKDVIERLSKYATTYLVNDAIEKK